MDDVFQFDTGEFRASMMESLADALKRYVGPQAV
jgi:hypothetical protein